MPTVPASTDAEPTIRIRPFERSELRQLLSIFSQAIPRPMLARSIYAAPEAEAFLGRLLEHRSLHAHEQLWGVELEKVGLVGAAHTRLIEDRHHLNNYAVLPAFQGRGLGSRMMTHWHDLARAHGARRLSLDVALENEGARRHYARFGFADQARTYEYRLDGRVDPPALTGVQLVDWPLAQASFAAYGFGRFALALGSERYSVDLRVGEFRLSSFDARLLAVLRAMDPARTILVRSSEPLENAAWSHVATSVHMTKEL